MLGIFEIRLAILYQVQVVMLDATPSISTASGQPSPLANAEDGTVIGALEGQSTSILPCDQCVAGFDPSPAFRGRA